MRPLLAWIVCSSIALAAPAPTAPGRVCPDGACPTWRAPGGSWGGNVPVPAEPAVDARPIARVVNTLGTARNLGSGTLVDADERHGWVVTCAHLFHDGAGSIVVTFPGGGSYQARLSRIDPATDLAALVIRRPAIEPVELASDYPQRGDPLVFCGYGSDGRLLCQRGQTLGYVTRQGGRGRETLELSGSARLGDSGGPVLDGRGFLVAVLFGTNGRVVDGTFCGRVRRFLRGLSPRFQAPRPSPPGRLPGPVEGGDPLVRVPPRRTEPPTAELPPDGEPIDGDGNGLAERARSWLSGKLAARLIAVGVPGGIAGAAGGAIVWLAMRRGRKRLHAELRRLKARLGEAPRPAAEAAESETQFVERHHNQYVPYEASVLDKAWADAHARVGERYPGAVPYLKIVEGVKDQLLSGHENPQLT